MVWRGVALSSDAGPRIKAPTLASVVARRLEDDVVAARWPVGQVLGSESDLLDRFGVSRAVLREAVRIVEHTGAARMRRGPGGGLVVARPNRDAVVAASNLWFSYVGATMSEMLEIRAPLLIAVARLASERVTPEGAAALLDLAKRLTVKGRVQLVDLVRIEGQIAAQTANPSLALFTDALADLGLGRLRGGWAVIRPLFSPAELADHASGYLALSQAVADGRADEAEEVTAALLGAVRDRVADVRQDGRRRRHPVGDSKLAEQVANALRDDIERAGWPVGSVIGSESELIERHGVSRAILREAVRILEHHGAVRTKRGPHGGLLVAQPDVTAIRRATRLLLEYEGVTAAGLSETRTLVETAMTRMAAGRITPTVAAGLKATLAAEAQQEGAATTLLPLHEQMAAASNNRLLVLFVEILADLVPHHVRADQRTPEAIAAIAVAVHRAHQGIVAAVVAGDVESAGRRMSRHLKASTGVLQ